MIGKSGIILLDNLKSPTAVNQETQQINEKALLMENIFITQSQLLLGFTCINPELLYIGSNKYNCTHSTVWIPKNSVEAVFTSKGILSSNHYLDFQIESKITFMEDQVRCWNYLRTLVHWSDLHLSMILHLVLSSMHSMIYLFIKK